MAHPPQQPRSRPQPARNRLRPQRPHDGFFVADRRFVNEALPRISAVGFKILLDLVASSPRPVRLAEVPYQFRSRLRGESKLDTTVAFEYLTLILDKLIGGIVPVQFVIFGLVGLSGVLVHLDRPPA